MADAEDYKMDPYFMDGPPMIHPYQPYSAMIFGGRSITVINRRERHGSRTFLSAIIPRLFEGDVYHLDKTYTWTRLTHKSMFWAYNVRWHTVHMTRYSASTTNVQVTRSRTNMMFALLLLSMQRLTSTGHLQECHNSVYEDALEAWTLFDHVDPQGNAIVLADHYPETSLF